jgi:hypothetical protein
MRKLLFCFSLILILFLVSCDMLAHKHPTNQNNTIWVSDNPRAYMRVYSNLNWLNIGKLYIDEHSDAFVEMSMDFEGTGVDVYDPSKFTFRERDGAIYVFDALLFSGTCKFRNNRFTITVGHSEVDFVAVGDVITFTRVDELPEWAVVSAVEGEGGGDEE